MLSHHRLANARLLRVSMIALSLLIIGGVRPARGQYAPSPLVRYPGVERLPAAESAWPMGAGGGDVGGRYPLSAMLEQQRAYMGNSTFLPSTGSPVTQFSAYSNTPPDPNGKWEKTPVAVLQPMDHPPPCTDRGSWIVPFTSWDFSSPVACPNSYAAPDDASAVYRSKTYVVTERPWIEWGRPFYEVGPLSPSSTLFGETNLAAPHFLVYGDWRTAVASNENGARNTQIATRLNLEADWKWTATERMHALITPFNRNNEFTRFEIVNGSGEFVDHFNINPTTAFFEGDLGAMVGGARGIAAPFDLPFTVGLIPLLFQNGIWMEDAILGAAVNLPARNSPTLGWPNYEVTLFAGFDSVTSPAFAGNNQAAQVFGATMFIEAYEGYIETGYAYLNDHTLSSRSYHNITAAFTRRYLNTISNSARVIVNAGQSNQYADPTADGVLVLMENSLITDQPSNVVPYFNLFAGFGQPQSVARGAAAGGVLRNTGINFETDNLTGYPTLDPTGHNTCGSAFGVNWMNDDFTKQLVLEGAVVHPFDTPGQRQALDNQYGIGARYQAALSNCVLLRVDGMVGILESASDITGARVELRYKF